MGLSINVCKTHERARGPEKKGARPTKFYIFSLFQLQNDKRRLEQELDDLRSEIEDKGRDNHRIRQELEMLR